MHKSGIAILFLALLLMIYSSCEKSADPAQVAVTLDEVTDITETTFKAHWNISTTDIKKASIVAMEDDATSSYIHKVSLTNPASGTQVIEGLKGATKYFVSIEIELNDGTVKHSNSKTVVTSFVTENVTFKTSDGIDIAGKVSYLGSLKSKSPGIIFMHELGVWVNNWKSSDVVRGLVARGFVCMVIDFRGHGNSTPIDNIAVLIEDWSLIAKDLSASIDYLKKHEKVQTEKLALVGASLGGIMAIAGNGYDEVIASVSLSAPRNGIYTIHPGMTIKSAYYIAGENDANNNTNFADEAQYMYDRTEDPKKITIKENISAHGTDMLVDKSLQMQIIDWLHLRLRE